MGKEQLQGFYKKRNIPNNIMDPTDGKKIQSLYAATAPRWGKDLPVTNTDKFIMCALQG